MTNVSTAARLGSSLSRYAKSPSFISPNANHSRLIRRRPTVVVNTQADRFDIVGRGHEGTPNTMRPAMLRGLLADRFQLVTHTETREQPVYLLVLARPDARLGPQLKRSPLPCASPGTAAVPGQSASCGVGVGGSANSGVATITTWGMAMDSIAAALANYAVNRAVINRTNLEGGFDVVGLRFAPEGFGLPAAS